VAAAQHRRGGIATVSSASSLETARITAAAALARRLDFAASNFQPRRSQMNGKQMALGIVLADFVALSGYAVSVHGYVGIFEALLSSVAGVQVAADLLISLALVAVWMWNDARKRGISPIPYVVLTALLGSIGPLVYLVRIVGSEAPERITMPARSPA
jgi:hypothetical protein